MVATVKLIQLKHLHLHSHQNFNSKLTVQMIFFVLQYSIIIVITVIMCTAVRLFNYSYIVVATIIADSFHGGKILWLQHFYWADLSAQIAHIQIRVSS